MVCRSDNNHKLYTFRGVSSMLETCNRCRYGVEIIRGDYKCEKQEIKIPRDEALYPFRRCNWFVFKNSLIKVKRVHENAELPKRATPESAGFDLHTVEDFSLEPGEHKAVRTGLAFEIPAGYAMFIFPRSGLAKNHGLTLSNAVGVVDSDYRGEVMVLLHNAGEYKVSFRSGERIAQAVIQTLPDIELVECEELSETARGKSGFGSTGL
ncbi:Deoxyuridine 5'-triphosphate nucleotidohydrolase Dut [Desulforamulus hydrothermalis Lam5 = DSM 18033]|uniref:dUTP diphosphatase n=2 Tax=Desulforamulus TaxID=2916693 RepID=K8DZ38_9FIRM|nr:Deoxyuridine 5'-triphosphate nucleotidohydrolase Dut [Desulforamulus hydrothermalis Lam5 = DSM 18033]SHH43428.1 dUTP pyrophosphatase [Desulforamulus hydrothermalis Lam5 = DSM 18033]